MLDTLIEKLIFAGGVPLLCLIVGWLANKYVRPWIHKDPVRLARAQEIALIADRLTDELVLNMPNSKIDDVVDTLVDKIIKSLGLSEAHAQREAIYQLAKRGKIKPVDNDENKAVAIKLAKRGLLNK